MPYSTEQELRNRVGSERLHALLNVVASEETALINAMTTRAESVIHGFAARRYKIPLSPSPLLCEWTLRIVEYELYKRAPQSAVPEKIERSYRECLEQLQALSKGELRLESEGLRRAAPVQIRESLPPGNDLRGRGAVE